MIFEELSIGSRYRTVDKTTGEAGTYLYEKVQEDSIGHNGRILMPTSILGTYVNAKKDTEVVLEGETSVRGQETAKTDPSED